MTKNIDDKMDLRRRRLRQYQEQSADEWQRIAKRTGLSASHLSQIMSGHRPFNEKTARQVEQRLQLAPGWLDISGDVSVSGHTSQIGDEVSLARIISAIDSALKASGKVRLKDEDRYGRLIEFVYEDSKERGMPTETWFTRLVKLILE